MFKKLLLISLTLCVTLVSTTAFADVFVRGHWRDTDGDGIKDTWVNPHYRTAPNSNLFDNYSTWPNINPYTGERGYKKPYRNFYYFKLR